MEKINFSGGEPFLPDRGEYLGKLVRFCKEELGLQGVSIISNGSLIRERWFQSYGAWARPWPAGAGLGGRGPGLGGVGRRKG